MEEERACDKGNRGRKMASKRMMTKEPRMMIKEPRVMIRNRNLPFHEFGGGKEIEDVRKGTARKV